MPVEASWKSRKSALVYGAVSPQDTAYTTTATPANFTEFADTDLFENEQQCLNLNVWTQSMDKSAKKPVIVWFHGGGYSSGASSELACYDGKNISEYGDVVFVSVNHRLNVLGYLDLSAYGEEYKYSGNSGTADQVMALQWVQKNIENFGGDPNNVTIVGQSGGGGKVMTLMGTPAAQGLFQRVWAMSGTQSSGVSQESSRQLAAAVIEYLGIEDSEDPVAYLKELPYNELLAAVDVASRNASFLHGGLGPVNDGDYYSGTIVDGKFVDIAKDIPLVITTTFGEMDCDLQKMLFIYGDAETTAELPFDMEAVKEKYGDKADQIAEEFQKAYPNKEIGDVLYINSGRTNDVVIQKKESGGQVWQGMFTYKLPVFGGVNAWHTGGDVPFIFHNCSTEKYLVAGDEVNAYAYQDICADALISYAYTGSPSTDSLEWPEFTVEKGETMILDTESYLGYYHDQKLLELLKEEPETTK